MDKLQYVLNYLVPFATIVLTYVLGRLQEHHSFKNSVLKERYEAVYVPFVSAIYRGMIWHYEDYSKMPADLRAVFFDMLFKNIQFIDKKTQALMPQYYTAYLNMLEYEEGNPEFISAPQEYNSMFSGILMCMLSETSKLSNKLHLPPLSKAVESKLFQC